MGFRDFDPFEDMVKMQRRFWRSMKRMWGPLGLPPMHGMENVEFESFPVDMTDKENEILLRADLPGFDKDDINVQVTEDTVDIHAKRKGERREEKEGYYYRERALSAVKRSLTLPSTVDPDSVEVDLRNGVLTLRMKKKESKKGREIKIR